MADLLNYRPSDSAVYYTWSRPLIPGKTILGLFFAVVLTGIGGFCYAKVERQIFFIHWRMLATLTAAITVGLLGLIPVKLGHVRNSVVAAILGVFLAVVALYVIWLTWLYTELNRTRFGISYHTLIWHPALAWRLVRIINEVGVWSLHGDAVRGFTAWLFWIAEASLIAAVGIMIPVRGIYGEDPECRECGAQCKRVPKLSRFAVDREKEFVAAVEARDFSSLSTYPLRRGEDDPELSLRLMSCPQCNKTQVLTVNRIAWAIVPRAGRKVVITPLVNQLMVTEEEAEQIKASCMEARPAQQDEDVTAESGSG